MAVGREQDRQRRRDEQQVAEEIRRLFERYRVTARQATEAAKHDDPAPPRPRPRTRRPH